MLTGAVSHAMRRDVAELTLDHVLVQLQSFSILRVGARGGVDDLAILVEDAVGRDGALNFGRPQEFECVCKLAVEGSRKQDSEMVSQLVFSSQSWRLHHTSQHSVSTQHPSSKRVRSVRRQGD